MGEKNVEYSVLVYSSNDVFLGSSAVEQSTVTLDFVLNSSLIA